MWSGGPDSNAALNDPSFTFSVNSSDELVATSQGVIAIGSFYFWVLLTGNVDVRA